MPGETGSSKEALLSMRCLVLGDIRDVGDEDVDTDNFLKGLWSRKLLRPLLRFGERFFRMSNMFKLIPQSVRQELCGGRGLECEVSPLSGVVPWYVCHR